MRALIKTKIDWYRVCMGMLIAVGIAFSPIVEKTILVLLYLDWLWKSKDQ